VNSEEKRIYGREWIAKRKAKAIQLLGGVCVVCGSQDYLEIDHIDPDTKDSRLRKYDTGFPWTWNWHWILNELVKCQLLCKEHHLEKTLRNGELSQCHSGERNPNAKLSAYDVEQIRLSDLSRSELAAMYNIHPATVSKIRRGTRWRKG
jgi:hypothetical protein